MTEEPYRWLEAIANRREYIREQLKGGTPVFALSRPEGILLLGVGQGQSKVFEIYDRQALAVLGHPVDIEKVRQAAIEAAHLEGFNRSSRDVTLRRLISFALSAQLKNAFEQIFAPPIIVESIFAELGETPADDVLVRVNFDGRHRYESAGLMVAHPEPKREEDATRWLTTHLQAGDSIDRCVSLCLTVWKALAEERSLEETPPPVEQSPPPDGRKLEAALLDRSGARPAKFRVLTF